MAGELISLEAKTDAASRLVFLLAETLKVDGGELLRDESKRLARTIATYIPPFGFGPSARKTALGAVDSDVKRLFSEATPHLLDEVGSRYGISQINTAYVTEMGGTRLNINWEHIDPEAAHLEQYHRDYRTQSGRITAMPRKPSTWSAHVAIPAGSRKPFSDKLQERTGRWKASWALLSYQLGDKPFPTWINRHFPFVSQGLSAANITKAMDKENPEIIMGSRAPGNFRMLQIIRRALDVRIRAMRKRIKLILSGYSKDVANGIRLEPGKAKSAPTDDFEMPIE